MDKPQIESLFADIDRSLFFIDGKLDYQQVTEALISLANGVHAFEGNTDDIWYIGEFENCALSDLIPGAYWHFTEWHGGQSSIGYEALCALGQVFNPGMSSIESEKEDGCASYSAYEALNNMAETYYNSLRA